SRRSLLPPPFASRLRGAPLASASRTAPFRCAPAWSFVPYVAGPGAPATSPLTVVSGAGPGDVWGVGEIGGSAVVLHFDGSTWSAPPQPTLLGSLHSVAAVSTTDAWAVGTLTNAHGSRTMVLHWAGSSWTRVQDASGPSTAGDLRRVVADGPNDVWAVGGVTDTS